MDAAKQSMWADGDAYERYIGRWSRLVAREFLAWLSLPPGAKWLDAGCGTGALSQSIAELCQPSSITGVDRSVAYLALARAQMADPRVEFVGGDASALPVADETHTAAVSGLVLNFVPEPALAAAEMARVTRNGGTVAAYVWDYAGDMQMIRFFWDAAAALDPAVRELDQGESFPLCREGQLGSLFRDGGLSAVQERAIDVVTEFRDFDDYWSPFLGGQGPAPTYVMSLSEDRRAALRETLRAQLSRCSGGSIRMVARAWAVRGER